jgi:hypothetical protein
MQEDCRYSHLLLSLVLNRCVCGQIDAVATLCQQETECLLNRRLRVPESHLGCVTEEIKPLPLLGNEPWIV